MWNQTQTFQEVSGCYTSKYMDTSVQNYLLFNIPNRHLGFVCELLSFELLSSHA